MKKFVQQIEDVIAPALTSQYKDPFQEGQAYIAEKVGGIIDALPEDPPIPADSRFPDWPTHPDFARLSAAVITNDDRADAGESIPDIFESDEDSLLYMASQRLRHVFGEVLDGMSSSRRILLQAIFIDAFTIGLQFERRGGARPADTGIAGDKEKK